MDKLLKIQQVADYLQISTEKAYKMAQQRKIPACKVGGQWRFKKDRIDTWLETQENVNS
jgi:excisionase family DNA binding protein